MTDRSELALQLTDAIAVARTAVERAGDRAFRAYGLSHRAHAALNAVDQGGPDGARPKDIAAALGVARVAATTLLHRLESEGLGVATPRTDVERGLRTTPDRDRLRSQVRGWQRLSGHSCDAQSGTPATTA